MFSVVYIWPSLFSNLSCKDAGVFAFIFKRLKVKRKDTCYSIVYMSHTSDQKCFKNLEMPTDWHELIRGSFDK